MKPLTSLNDQELISLIKEDRSDAFAEIYQRYKVILYTHALNKLRNREEAQDVIQEVFVYLWSKRDSLEFSSNFSGYLYKAVHNAVLNRISHTQVRYRYMDSLKAFADIGHIETDFRIREQQLRALIDKEISMLPPKMREIFELSRNGNLSHREIAANLQISEQTVSKQITNALKILKSRLGLIGFLYLLLHR